MGERATANHLLDAALKYAAEGMHVLPLKPGEKVPITANGVKDATTDEDQIREWWKKHPGANIGIACGPSNLLVVDIDVKNGKNGLETWETIVSRLGIEGHATLTSATPSGGKHLYYRLETRGINNSVGKLGNGIDTRGEGGYVVAPFSVIEGREYKWDNCDSPIEACPPGIVEALTRAPSSRHPWWSYRTCLDDILSRPPAPTRWLVDGMIEEGSFVLVYGAAGSLKSMLVAELALCVAAGRPWLDPRPGESSQAGATVTAKPAVWLDLDNGSRRTHQRSRALAAARGIRHVAMAIYSFPPLDLADPSSVSDLVAAVQEEGAGLVVIDTLINASSIHSENDNAQLRGPLYALRGLCESTGATVVVIHHASKGASTDMGHNDIRGGGAIAGAVDVAIRVSRKSPDSNSISIKCTKMRGAPMPPLAAEWECETDDRGDLVKGRFWRVPRGDSTEGRLDDLKKKVLGELGTASMNVSQLRSKLSCKKENLSHALRQLKNEGKIAYSTEPRNQGKIYELL